MDEISPLEKPHSQELFALLLGRNKHSHPLIYMRVMKSDDLLAIMDFLYLGAVNIFQENLDSFLLIAEELQLKGFAGKKDEKIKDFKEYDNKSLPQTFLPETMIPKNIFRGHVQWTQPPRRKKNTGNSKELFW